MLLPVSVYGGYFGAGLGVLLVAVMQLATGGEYRPANAAKNLVAALNGLAAVAVFALKGGVNWPAALAMTSGALFGALIGVRIARIAPREVMRWVVVAIGATLTDRLCVAILVLGRDPERWEPVFGIMPRELGDRFRALAQRMQPLGHRAIRIGECRPRH